MPVLETKGASSAQGFGLTTPVQQLNYIEDVFSTWLYTGTGAVQTITNGIDLAGKGGLVWTKVRSVSDSHNLQDTARGATLKLSTDLVNGQLTQANSLTSFSSNGYSLGSDTNAQVNGNTKTYVSWTFREQPKFFDIVTYTGDGANRTITHNLGSVPGCIIVKRTDTSGNWQVYHRSLANTQYMVLNSTAAVATGATRWNSTTPTSTVFSVGTDATVNASGGTYVAYIFAHDAGGFGNAGTDNVISCGSFTTDGSGIATVTLGYEPQWVLSKKTNGISDWIIVDSMRGNPTPYPQIANQQILRANTSGAEGATYGYPQPTATGFITTSLDLSSTYIYIAIRRGPMKTPTVGTSVFGLNARTGTGANATVTGGQTDDAVLIKNRGGTDTSVLSTRLTGTGLLYPYGTEAESAAPPDILQANPWDVMNGVKVGTTSSLTNASANTFINYLFRRAPGFFDVVCYTGTGVVRTVNHNLGVAPELIIVKCRSEPFQWPVYSSSLGATDFVSLDMSSATAANSQIWNNTQPTANVFTTGVNAVLNGIGRTYVAYLFATVAGVSKVGSYTGTAATLTVNCGFTTGARFVLIKRTDSTGDWYVWDSARGITAGNDPYWRLNALAAEVTTTDWVDTAASGFELSNSAGNLANVVGGTYIFLAIA
jgi:hypothetical protein